MGRTQRRQAVNALAAAHEINGRVLECLTSEDIEVPLDCLPTDAEVAEIIEKYT